MTRCLVSLSRPFRGAVLAVCLGVGVASSAFAVDYGSASRFLLFDYNVNTGGDGKMDKGTFNGDVGWSTPDDKIILSSDTTLNGTLFKDSSAEFDNSGTHNDLNGNPPGPIVNDVLSPFIMDAQAAAQAFEDLNFSVRARLALINDYDEGIFRSSIRGSDAFSSTGPINVFDFDQVDLSNHVITINGNPGDLFYFRVADKFQWSNTQVVINGTDSTRVFFYYSGEDDMDITNGSQLLGNFFSSNEEAILKITNTVSFKGTAFSNGGFEVGGGEFNQMAPIPEPSTLWFGLLGWGFFGLRRRRSVKR